MVERPHWLARIGQAFQEAPVVWLSGVRRVGKTVLAGSLGADRFLNCDLPSSVERLRDPESFFRGVGEGLVVLDEVHQLADPSRILKIGADAFPGVRILATGSSTLAATRKFRDSLTGRKRSVEMVPVLAEEIGNFGVTDLDQRLLRGGLPPAMLGNGDAGFYAEWLDSYFARDVQELFRLGKRTEFLQFVELVLLQSGGMLEVTSLSKHAGVTRPTVLAWLDVLQTTHVARLLRPYAMGGRREIVGRPKLYGFDTGFVCHARGWETIRADDRGNLWEHLVLETLASIPVPKIGFWRDKQQREIDFVVPRGQGRVDAIECKWNVDAFETRNLAAFRANYPEGRNYLVSPRILERYEQNRQGVNVVFLPIGELRSEFATRSE
jgi:predicted AAA+ superfamily ATPase